MGEALRRGPEDGGSGRRASAGLAASRATPLLRRAVALALSVALLALAPLRAQDRFVSGRFTVLAYPTEATLARWALAEATRRDSFPGLPRPRAAVTLLIAPDERRFREWVGPYAPEWGAAI